MTTKYATYSLVGAALLFFAALTLSVSSASAQTTNASASSSSSTVCPTVDGNLWYGMGQTNAVASLQEFLFARGYFKTHVTGPFGPLTRAAVVQMQRDNGIPSTGFVGPLTRAFLSRLCSGDTTSAAPVIYHVTPTSGPVGTSVTIDGRGFSHDNTIHFGSGVISHVDITSSSAISCTTDPSCIPGIHQTITFNVPTALDPACRASNPPCMVASRMTTPGTYMVTVENQNGTSNAITFTVTDGTTTTASPVVYKVTPTSGPVGTSVTIDGRGFSSDNVVHFGNGAIAHVGISRTIAIACTNDPSCVGGIHQYLTFTIPDAVGPYCAAGMMCPMWMQKVTPGVYQISVESNGATSNSVPFTVTDGGATSSAPIITSVSPSTASYGSLVTLTGSGFTDGAVLHFYQNGTPFATTGLTVSSDTSASFKVPEWTGVYCRLNAMCIALAKQLPNGSYTIAIETKNGISNQVGFTVGANTNTGTLSISGLDAPATLAMGVSGTWTVHASAPSTAGTLHYSVVWGDEAQQANAAIAAPAPHDIQTSASFTHAYRTAGTYTAVFTVTDDSGHSAQTSSTITVTPWY